MKNILLPTDFSQNAENAIEYALFFAEKTNANIKIFHSYKIDIPITDDVTTNQLRLWEEEEETEAVEKMHEVVKRLKEKTNTDPAISYEARRGNLPDHIQEKIAENNLDLLIMGTKGSGNIRNRFFGSNSADALKIASIPVLLIPEKAKFHNLKHIVYATEYQYADVQAIQNLIELGIKFDATITILHISKVKDQAEQELYQTRYKRMIEKYFDYDKLNYKVFKSSDISGSLSKFVKDQQGHLLSMSTKNRNVWQRLFDKSMTENMAYQTEVPLLAFKARQR